MHNNNHKRRASTLSKALVAAGLLGIIGYGNAANAASKFFNLQVLLPSNGEIFNLNIETEDAITLMSTVTPPKYPAPSRCEPFGLGDCPSVTGVSGAQLESPAYKFTGFKILNIKGTAKEGGMTYDVKGPGIAATTGVFNYPTGPTLPNPPSIPGNPGNPGPIVDADSIPHSLPDQLFNPKGLGLGFDPTGFDYGDPAAFISFPADALDNYFSFGGITFDIGHLATPGDYSTAFTLEEPYQLFTVPYDSTSTTTGESLKAGVYAGCPGSCKGAVVQTPGPLPLLGIGAAFGFSRNLRKRIKATKTPEAMSALG
jgi:hypothetical protein